jgi:hypothetical protein
MNRIAIALLAALAAAPAAASMIAPSGGGWYMGSWTCRIDGRPARMVWRVVDDTQTSCRGDNCTTTQGAKLVGSFSDSGSRWVELRQTSASPQELKFLYAGTDRWFLRNEGSGRAKGYTTWQGNRYPLECRKA